MSRVSDYVKVKIQKLIDFKTLPEVFEEAFIYKLVLLASRQHQKQQKSYMLPCDREKFYAMSKNDKWTPESLEINENKRNLTNRGFATTDYLMNLTKGHFMDALESNRLTDSKRRQLFRPIVELSRFQPKVKNTDPDSLAWLGDGVLRLILNPDLTGYQEFAKDFEKMLTPTTGPKNKQTASKIKVDLTKLEASCKFFGVDYTETLSWFDPLYVPSSKEVLTKKTVQIEENKLDLVIIPVQEQLTKATVKALDLEPQNLDEIWRILVKDALPNDPAALRNHVFIPSVKKEEKHDEPGGLMLAKIPDNLIKQAKSEGAMHQALKKEIEGEGIHNLHFIKIILECGGKSREYRCDIEFPHRLGSHKDCFLAIKANENTELDWYKRLYYKKINNQDEKTALLPYFIGHL